MKNRRVFQRKKCAIPVLIHQSGRFLYGEVTELSLGGVKLQISEPLKPGIVELSPRRRSGDKVVIPLQYKVCWQSGAAVMTAGLQFISGTDAFFRGWLSDHIKIEDNGLPSILDKRDLVRVPCELSSTLELEDRRSLQVRVLDISLGGLSFFSEQELYPGMSCLVAFLDFPELENLEVMILRVQRLQDQFLCGVRYLEPSEEQGRVLEQLVTSLVEPLGAEETD